MQFKGLGLAYISKNPITKRRVTICSEFSKLSTRIWRTKSTVTGSTLNTKSFAMLEIPVPERASKNCHAN